MSRPRSLLLLAFMTAPLVCRPAWSDRAPVSKVEGFFAPAADSGRNLPTDELYPRGRRMLFSLYSVVSPQLARMKADGFTCIGPYYGDQTRSEVLKKAHAAGLKCFYRVGKAVPFVRNPKYVMPSEDELREVATQQVKAVCADRSLAIWYVANEELRFWRPDEMRWLRVTTEAIRAADPLKRPIMMYDPNHRTAGALAHTVRYLDFCSKGMYANSAGFKNNRIWIRWSVEQELEAIRRANPRAVPVAVLWMARDPADPQEDRLIPAWTRHDVYLSLVSGAKGIVIWSGWNRRRGFQRTFEKYYEGYASAARELNGPRGLAEVLLFGEARNDLTLDVLSGPAQLVVDYQNQHKVYSPLTTRNVAYGTTRYFFVVNSANEPVRARLTGLPGVPTRVENLLDAENVRTAAGGFTFELPPLGVACYKLHDEGHGP